MLFHTLLLGSLLALVSAQSSQVRGALNSSQILDSINKDLDEIKRTIAQSSSISNSNRVSSYAASAVGEPKVAAVTFAEGQYLKVAEEANKTGDKPYVLCSRPTDDDSIYKYSIKYLNASLGTLDFNTLRGKPILVVNVATFCESTIEYPLLNGLKDKFGDKLEIIAFPSGQFANQEPTDNPTEIFNAIRYVRPGNGFIPKFPLTIRIDVNGENRDPIYSFLKRSCPATRTRLNSDRSLLYSQKNGRDIRWNFEKFLIHPVSGTPWKRYDQKFTSDRIADDVQLLLDEQKK